MFIKGLFRGIDQRIGLISYLYLLPSIFVFLDMEFCFFHHLLDFFFCNTTGRGNSNGLLLTSTFIYRRDIKNAIGVYIKSYFYLRHAAGCCWNAYQMEAA